MIPQAYITEWSATAPWQSDAQVEQDLILSRAIIEIFSDPLMEKSLAFRGGTALNKLFFQPSTRYSEDIDLVQIEEGSIGAIFEALRNRLNPFLGEPKWKLKEGRAIFIYRFSSESYPITPMKVKVEINTREHFSVLGLQKVDFEVKNTWYSKKLEVVTYELEELLGTKLRALYQRKKGRDLFDLTTALRSYPSIDSAKLIECFERYMSFSGTKVSRAQFEANLAEKISDSAFINDIKPLLPLGIGSKYEPQNELSYLNKKIIQYLPGEPWKANAND